MKKALPAFLACVLIVSFAAIVRADNPDVYMNNHRIGVAVPKNGAFYILVSSLLKETGEDLSVNPKTAVIEVNGVNLKPRAIKTKHGWLVPVRETALALGYQIDYNKSTGMMDLFFPRGSAKYGAGAANADIPVKDGMRVINSNSPGSVVDVSKYVVKGKVNIFCFFSNYCPVCRKIVPQVQKLARDHQDEVVLNEVDINRPGFAGIDYQSPVGAEYDIRFTPYFMIYGKDGWIVLTDAAQGYPANRQVMQMLHDNLIEL